MPRTHSQLQAIYVGSYIKSSAVTSKPEEKAASCNDTGCFEIDFTKMPAAVRDLEMTVLRIKATADKAGAEKLKVAFVDAKDDFAQIKDTVRERWLRAPRASLVYSLKF